MPEDSSLVVTVTPEGFAAFQELMSLIRTLRQNLGEAHAVAEGKVKTYRARYNGKEIAVPAEEARRERRSIKLAMEAITDFCERIGFDQELLRPFLWVTNAVGNAEKGATDPIFMPPRAQNRGPGTEHDAQISGTSSAAIKLLEKIVTQKEVAQRIAKEISKAGIVADAKTDAAANGRRRYIDPFSSKGILATFRRVKAMEKQPPKERNRNHTKRVLYYFHLALYETVSMAPEDAFNMLMANLRTDFGKAP